MAIAPMTNRRYIRTWIGNDKGADGRTRVLLLEAGRASHPLSRIPISFAKFINNPATNWCYEAEPDETLRRSDRIRDPAETRHAYHRCRHRTSAEGREHTTHQVRGCDLLQ